jgi:flagellar biosynthesis protein FlhB
LSEDQDQSQKTEEPSQRKLERARDDGQVPQIKEVSNLLILFTAGLIIMLFIPYFMRQFTNFTLPLLESAENFSLSNKNIFAIINTLVFNIGGLLLIPFGAIAVAGIIANLLQHGIVFSSKTLEPKLEKISLLKGIKRIFSAKNFFDLLKALLYIVLIGSIMSGILYPEFKRLEFLVSAEAQQVLTEIYWLIFKVFVGVISLLCIFALIDYLFQRAQFTKQMRMTKQEVKEEHKESEGDPQIKAKIRQIRNERAKKRMMAAVPEADVIVTNPTHFAIALKYDKLTMRAPVVVAKGRDLIAAKIREVAENNKVPVVRNPPLARNLFKNVEIDEEVPYEYYKAVAEIIIYVMRLKNKMPEEYFSD